MGGCHCQLCRIRLTTAILYVLTIVPLYALLKKLIFMKYAQFKSLILMKTILYSDVTSWSPVDCYKVSDGIFCLHFKGRRMKMAAAGSSKTLVTIYQSTRHHVPEYS
jgi:hypothetical protein